MSWTTVRIEEIAASTPNALSTGPFGSSISAQFFRGHGVPVIRGSNLSNEIGIRLSHKDFVFLDESLARSFERSAARKGDLVFTCWGTIDQIGLIDDRALYDRYIVSNKQMKLTPDPTRANSLFLYYLFSSPVMRERIIAQGIGSSVPGFNLGQLRALVVTIPPVDEQCAIAELLGALDDKIELNRQMIRTLGDMGGMLFERWIRKFEEGDDHRTRVQDLINAGLLEVGDGYRAKRSELATAGLPFARAGNIDAGFQFDDAEIICWASVGSAGRKVSQPLDVVFTSKGTVGRFAFVGPSTSQFVYSPQLCFWRSLDAARISPYFLYHWMQSRRFLDQVDATKGQTDMADYVSLTDQRAMEITCPPHLAHQQLASMLAPLWELHFQSTDESHTLSGMRDTLLPKLLSGEIRLKQAEKALAAVL